MDTQPELDDQKHRYVGQNEPLFWSENGRTPPIENTLPLAGRPEGEKAPRGNFMERVENWIGDAWTAFRTKPWGMFFFLVTGTAFAIAHHLFYLRLQGREAKEQSLMVRYGTIIAFCAKASFGTAVVIAFQQRAWMVVRRRMVRLGAVDSIFTANHDFTSLLDWRAMRKAKIAMCLAVYVWLTPLIVALTSETLFVVTGLMEESAMCPSARTLNFSNEDADWRLPSKVHDYFQYSTSRWNLTTMYMYDSAEEFSDLFDYWAGPSSVFRTLVNRVMYMREAAVRENISIEVCSQGWNCSYVVDFVAPGYKCEQLAHGVNATVKKLGNLRAPFGTKDLVPAENLTYLAVTNEGDYAESQIRSGPHGIPLQKRPYPKNLGAFRTEPVLWIGYVEVNDTSVPQPAFRDESDWNDAYTPVIFGCEHYEVNYTVVFNYTSGVQNYDIKRREYLKKVVETTFVRGGLDPDKRLLDRTKAVPEENYIYPTDVANYRRTAAFYSVGYVFRSYLKGTIGMPYYIMNTEMFESSALLTQPNWLPVRSLQQAVQKLYEDILISFFSDNFLATSWASNGETAGPLAGNASTVYRCTRQQLRTFFAYNKDQLLTVYAVSLALALVGVLLGLQAVREEGTVLHMRPSAIIDAAKASILQNLGTEGSSEVKIGYGLVQQQGGGDVRNFGVAGHVMQEHARPRRAFWKDWMGRKTTGEN